jgi:protein arginine kinase
MTLADLTQRTSEWLRGIGPMHDVVISSRVRLARNLAGMPFLSRCDKEQKLKILEELRDTIPKAALAKNMFFVDLESANQADRLILVERHLISKQHAESDHPRGVIISANENIALMINEEDHLRMQVLRSGLQLNEAFEEINRIDDLLEEHAKFSFSSRFGYLTACPTNVGTGLRVSVMLHLPGLKLTGEIDKALRAAHDMHLAIRGAYGEGTDAVGDFLQISNQVTLGKTEEQIVNDFLTVVVPPILNYERSARKSLLKHNTIELDDRIFRACAILREARKISSEEAMYLLSMVRLGINLERIKDISLKDINELSLTIQPAHLQKIHDKELNEREQAVVRAEFLRKKMYGEK